MWIVILFAMIGNYLVETAEYLKPEPRSKSDSYLSSKHVITELDEKIIVWRTLNSWTT